VNATRRTFLQAAAGLGLVSAPTSGRGARAQALPKVRYVASSPVVRPYHAYLYAGARAGLHQKIGIEPEFLFISGSAAALQLLIAGDADIGNIGILEFIAAKKRQPTLPLSLIYCHDYRSSYVTVVPEDSPIKTVADFKGKSVGVLSLAAGTVPTVKAMARQAGIDPASVQFIAVGADAAALVALKSGRVDALSFFIGSVAGLENLGMKFRSFSPEVSSGVFATSNAFLTKNRDLAVRGLQGIALSTRFAQLNPAAAARNYYAMFQQPIGDRDKALRDDVHAIEKTLTIFKQPNDGRLWGELTEADWKKLIVFAGPEFGMTAEDTRYADFFNGSLIADVNKVDMTLAEAAAKSAPAQ
jgi:NitT/TauT family transport system substrate-binding protein